MLRDQVSTQNYGVGSNHDAVHSAAAHSLAAPTPEKLLMKFVHKDGSVEYVDIAGPDEELDEFDYEMMAELDKEREEERLNPNPDKKTYSLQELRTEFGLDD